MGVDAHLAAPLILPLRFAHAGPALGRRAFPAVRRADGLGDFFGQGVQVRLFFGDHLHGIARGITPHHEAGEREEAQALFRVIVVEHVASHDEVLVALIDHRAVAFVLNVRQHGPLHAGEGLFDAGAEFLVRVLLFLFQEKVVQAQAEAWLVGRQHGQQQFGCQVGYAARSHALVE